MLFKKILPRIVVSCVCVCVLFSSKIFHTIQELSFFFIEIWRFCFAMVEPEKKN